MATTAWKDTLLSSTVSRSRMPTSPTVVQPHARLQTPPASATSSSTVERLRERISAWESVTVRIADVGALERAALDAPGPVAPPASKMIPRRAILPPSRPRARHVDAFSLPRSTKSLVVGFDDKSTQLSATEPVRTKTPRTIIRVENSAVVPIDGPTESRPFIPPRVKPHDHDPPSRGRSALIAATAIVAAFTVGLVAGKIGRDMRLGAAATAMSTSPAATLVNNPTPTPTSTPTSTPTPTPTPTSTLTSTPTPTSTLTSTATTVGAIASPTYEAVANVRAAPRRVVIAPRVAPKATAAADLFEDRD